MFQGTSLAAGKKTRLSKINEIKTQLSAHIAYSLVSVWLCLPLSHNQYQISMTASAKLRSDEDNN